ncbi:MAG: hypothetical protein JWN08_852 [Frankiales bacterium]|nr:hypothetical protein [Frankiales bacterium]
MVLERLSARLLADGVPPSLLIDLLDPVGMQHALASELAETEAGRTLAETDLPRAVEQADAQTA